MIKKSQLTLAAAICVALGTPALSADLMEEIVVTAQKREQKAQDVGISITALSGEQLNELGVVDSTQLIQVVPGLRNPKSNSGFTSSFSIRGLSQSDFGASQEAPVALYVDEVYQSSQGAAQFLTFDLDRVEVLRGPQGTLFGRNATGGLVHFLTARPTQTVSGYTDLSYGRFNDVKLESAINQPLNDNWAMRVSVAGRWHDRIVDNLTAPDMWNANQYAARLQLLYKPSADFSFLLSARGARRIDVGQPWLWSAARATGPHGTGVFAPGETDFFGASHPDDPFTVSTDPVSYDKAQTHGVTGTLTWNLGSATLTSITDASHVHVDLLEDSDMDVGEFFHYNGVQNQNQFSEELRLNGDSGPLRWVTGLYFLSIDGDYKQLGKIRDLGFPGVGAEDTIYDVKTTSTSIFGQVEYDLSPQWRAIVGARYIRDHKTQHYVSAFKDVTGGTSIGFGSSPDLLRFDGRFNDGNVSAKAELDWLPAKDVLVYASVNRGIKSGGFNAPLDPSGSPLFIDPNTFDPAPTADATMRFKPEKLNAYEVGLKSTFLDGKARFNTSVFYYDYKDFQALNFAGLTNFILNRDATLKGVDTELFASPVQGLDIVLGASYLSNVVKGVPVGGDVVDREIAYAPKWNLTALIRYEWAAFGGKLSAQANANSLSRQNFSLSNSAVTEEKPYTVANARLSFAFPGERLTAAVYVDNFTNKIYRTTAFDTAASFGSVESQIDYPRTYGINFRYQWGK